jgi:hypothetical protein
MKKGESFEVVLKFSELDRIAYEFYVKDYNKKKDIERYNMDILTYYELAKKEYRKRKLMKLAKLNECRL